MHLAVDRVQAYYFSTRTKFTKRSKVVTRFLIKFCRLTLRKGLEMKMWAIPSSSFCFCSSFLPLNSCFCLLFTCVVCRETVIWQSRWTTQKPDQNDPNHLRLRNKKIEKKRRWNGNKTKNLLLEFRPPRAGPECFLYLIFQFSLSFFIFKVYFDLRAKKRREMKGWVYRESGRTWWTVFDTWPNRYPTCLYTKFRERQISIGAQRHHQKQKANHPKSLSPIGKKGMKKIQFLYNTVAVSLFFSIFSINFSI